MGLNYTAASLSHDSAAVDGSSDGGGSRDVGRDDANDSNDDH